MSRYYTNVNIPEQFDQQDSILEQLELLQFENSRLKKKIDRLYRELENIPNAIEEYGYVDLTYDNDKKRIKIIKAPDTEER